MVDPAMDFMQAYPDLKAHTEFGVAYECNPSLPWVAVMYASKWSTYRNLAYDEFVDVMEAEYVEEGFFEQLKPFFDRCVEAVRKLELSSTERHLVTWKKKLDEKTAFMDSVPYDGSTYEMLDKLMSSNDKIISSYNNIKKMVEKEQSQTGDGNVHGGEQESLSELGEI